MALVRGLAAAMSEVYSFRLSAENPREAQAMAVIEAWTKQGYSLRNLLTEALLLLDNQETDSNQINKITETVERLAKIVERLDDHVEISKPAQLANSELSKSFLSSIKLAIKPGLR